MPTTARRALQRKSTKSPRLQRLRLKLQEKKKRRMTRVVSPVALVSRALLLERTDPSQPPTDDLSSQVLAASGSAATNMNSTPPHNFDEVSAGTCCSGGGDVTAEVSWYEEEEYLREQAAEQRQEDAELRALMEQTTPSKSTVQDAHMADVECGDATADVTADVSSSEEEELPGVQLADANETKAQQEADFEDELWRYNDSTVIRGGEQDLQLAIWDMLHEQPYKYIDMDKSMELTKVNIDLHDVASAIALDRRIVDDHIERRDAEGEWDDADERFLLELRVGIRYREEKFTDLFLRASCMLAERKWTAQTIMRASRKRELAAAEAAHEQRRPAKRAKVYDDGGHEEEKHGSCNY